MMQIVKPLRSGQLTIPACFREKLGIDSETFLEMSLVHGELRIRPVSFAIRMQDTVWFKKLYDRFSRVRKEAQSFSEKEIDQVIDRAVRAVRKNHAKDCH